MPSVLANIKLTMSSLLANLKNLRWNDVKSDPWPLVASWLLGALLAIVIPIVSWNNAKREWYNDYGYANEYEQEQEQDENEDEDEEYNPSCSWWQWRCRKNLYYYDENGGGNQDNEVELPGWYFFIGGTTEEDRRAREEMGQDPNGASGMLKFVYAWSLIVFIAVVAWGVGVMYKKQSLIGLVGVLILCAQFAMMLTFVLGQGVISTEGRELEDSVYGWYGQWSVLMVYTNFWFMLYCYIFAIVFAVRLYVEHRQRVGKSNAAEEANSGDYQNYEESHGKQTSNVI